MKQVELANRLGVSRAYITMLIKGERKPSKKLQRRINKLTKECSLPDTLLGNGVQVVAGSNPATPTSDRFHWLLRTPCPECLPSRCDFLPLRSLSSVWLI